MYSVYRYFYKKTTDFLMPSLTGVLRTIKY